MMYSKQHKLIRVTNLCAQTTKESVQHKNSKLYLLEVEISGLAKVKKRKKKK